MPGATRGKPPRGDLFSRAAALELLVVLQMERAPLAVVAGREPGGYFEGPGGGPLAVGVHGLAPAFDLFSDASDSRQSLLCDLAVVLLDVDVQLVEGALLTGPSDDRNFLDLLSGELSAQAVNLDLLPVGLRRALLDQLVQGPPAHQLVIVDPEQ